MGLTGRAIAGVVLAVMVVACGGATPPAHEIDLATGFPRGAFSKEFTDPASGRVRIDWVFGHDGRWAEVPIPLDGQRQPAPVVRGTYAVDGDAVTITTAWPDGWGTSRHRWRMDGDDLWTVFLDSDTPGDADWFAPLDTMPWRPVR